MGTTAEQRRHLQSLDRAALEQYQLGRLNALLRSVLVNNQFYREKLQSVFSSSALAAADGPLESLADFQRLPLTVKEELLPAHIEGQRGGPLARNATFPQQRYLRYHQTSGTRGLPLPVVDTADDWRWWMDCWDYVLDAADVNSSDCVFLAFSFGPFIGFWSAHDAAIARGCMVVPGGGMSTLARLELMRSVNASVLFCTPTYAMHMAQVARDNQIDPCSLGVRTLIVAGEPGGSDPDLRPRLMNSWNANVLDHSGATEVGPWGYGDPSGQGLHVMESEFVAEFLDHATGQPAAEGELAELVLTNLGRLGCPVIRYRTGDLVRPQWSYGKTSRFVFLPRGVLSRADDMLIVRGVNIFPSSVEQILRSFPEIVEYRITASKRGAMDELSVEIEDRLSEPRRVAKELEVRLGLTVHVHCVELGSLPRSEFKSRRWVDKRGQEQD
jgi:phenylacetate-CoA ligase